jgi:hypothetical protein
MGLHVVVIVRQWILVQASHYIDNDRGYTIQDVRYLEWR